MGAYPVLLEEERRALGGLDIEAHIVEAADERQRLVLILIGYGREHRAVIHYVHSARLLPEALAENNARCDIRKAVARRL